MHPKNFVICDVEKEYARNLMQAVGARKELGFQMHLFQSLDHLEAFSRKKDIHILLLGEEFPAEKRQEISAKERYVLVKGNGKELLPEEKEIYKYQSVDSILARILEESMDKEEMGHRNISGVGHLIGIYSPIHRIGRTKFALDLGKDLAKNGPVLYLNLEEYSGGNYYFPDQTGQNLGDLLYYIRQEKGNLGLRISTMAGQIGDLNYIAPMPVTQDLREVREEEWLKLCDEILTNCIYKNVILDLGDGIKGLYSLLRACHTVYTLHPEDPVSQAKLFQYTENLRLMGFEDVLEHTVLKKVPVLEPAKGQVTGQLNPQLNLQMKAGDA